jgi:uncharacterized membrane protein YphA (DoxX/SURF4 family)
LSQSPLGRWILLLLRLGLATVFIVFAIPKIAAPDLFAGNIFNYQMLPAWAVNLMALVLPWLELFVGICLALGIWMRASAMLIAGLMVMFMIAYGSARARGLDIACGCFEVGSQAKPASSDLGAAARFELLGRGIGLGALPGRLAVPARAPAPPGVGALIGTRRPPAIFRSASQNRIRRTRRAV